MGPLDPSYDPGVKKIIALSLCASIVCSGMVLAQEKTPEPKPETPEAPAPSPAPKAPANPPAETAHSPAPGAFENTAAVDAWMATYYLRPEPNRVLEAFRTLAREHAIGLNGRDNADKSWNYTAFFWACMRENSASMAEWCATIGHLDEPAKTWWWTPVWMSQTVAGNEAINAAMALPVGHADRIDYKWLQQKPVDILQTPFRQEGKQQISMLWSAFEATGDKAMIYKMYEGFVPPEPRQPKDEIDAQLVQKKRERNQAMIENTRKGFAENLPKHPKALELCKESIQNLRDPVKSEITRLVAEAEAKVAAEHPAPATSKADTQPTPEPKPEVAPRPQTEPKPEPKTEPK